MTVQLIDGFDVYNGIGANTGIQAKWSAVGGTNASMTAGRFGGQALRCASHTTSSVGTYFRSLPGNYAAVGVGFAYRCNAVAQASATVVNNMFAALSDSAGVFHVGLALGSDGKIHAYRLTAITTGTLLGSSAAGVIADSTWHSLEWEAAISDTVGSITVKVDGVAVLTLTSQDTRNGAPTTVGRVYFKGPVTGNNLSYDFDDTYVTDTGSTLGDRRVETLYPTSDVAQGFARSTGATNYTLVDEATVNGDTDYVQGSSVGDVDTYGFGNLSSTPTTIDAVQLASFAEKTDATARSIALQAKSGATTSDGSDYALATSYGKQERLLLLNPDGSVAWTASSVNALQGGPKVTV